MLLFRPSLSRYCTNRDSSCEDPLISLSGSFPQRVTLQCSIICVRAAQELIELIYNKVPSDGTNGPLPAWWYNILCKIFAIACLLHSTRADTEVNRCVYSSYCFDRRPTPFGNRGGDNRTDGYSVLEPCT